MTYSRLKDFFLRLFFSWGAKLYSNKLASGPEADLRRDFLTFASPNPGDRVLDVGCGPGWLAIWAAQQAREVVGCDRSKRIIKIAKSNARKSGAANVVFHTADATSLPYPNESFDVVIATTLIYLLPQRERGFAELVRVTVPGGRVATLDPDVSMSFGRMRAYAQSRKMNFRNTSKLLAWSVARIYYPFSEEELRELYIQAGLEGLVLEKRMDGMVWFAKAAKAGSRTAPTSPSRR